MGKVVVVLYPNLNVQKNYVRHCQAVSVLELSPCQKMVASGEMGSNPTIHLWEIKTLRTIATFKKVHKHSISFIKFTWEGKFLITVGERENAPVIILNIHTKEVLLSTYVESPIHNIITLSSRPNDIFLILAFSIVVMEGTGMSFKIAHHKMGEKATEIPVI